MTSFRPASLWRVGGPTPALCGHAALARRAARVRRSVGRVCGSLLAIAAGLGASAQPALAQSDSAAARALFAEGRSLMEDERYAEACPKLEESLRLDHGMGTQFNLAHCWEKLGRTGQRLGAVPRRRRGREGRQPTATRSRRPRAGEGARSRGSRACASTCRMPPRGQNRARWSRRGQGGVGQGRARSIPALTPSASALPARALGATR